MCQRPASELGVVDPVADGACVAGRDVGGQRIVAARDDRRLGRQLGEHAAPALGDRLELAVAVELVAEEVAQRQRVRLHAAHDRGQRRLVALEQPELGGCSTAGAVDEGGGNAREQVGAGRVAAEVDGRIEDGGDHRARRRLAVRRRDRSAAERQRRGELLDALRRESVEHAPGQGRAAAPATRARERAHDPSRAERGLEPDGHTSRIGAARVQLESCMDPPIERGPCTFSGVLYM